MLYILTLQVMQAQDKLPHDDPCLLLHESSALLQQVFEIQTVSMLINHVDVVMRHKRLVVFQAVAKAPRGKNGLNWTV